MCFACCCNYVIVLFRFSKRKWFWVPRRLVRYRLVLFTKMTWSVYPLEITRRKSLVSLVIFFRLAKRSECISFIFGVALQNIRFFSTNLHQRFTKRFFRERVIFLRVRDENSFASTLNELVWVNEKNYNFCSRTRWEIVGELAKIAYIICDSTLYFALYIIGSVQRILMLCFISQLFMTVLQCFPMCKNWMQDHDVSLFCFRNRRTEIVWERKQVGAFKKWRTISRGE